MHRVEQALGRSPSRTWQNLVRTWQNLVDLAEFSGMQRNIVENGKLPQIAVDCGNLVLSLWLLSRWKQVDVYKVLRRCPVTEGDKVQLLYKIFISRRLSKKLDYVRLGLFKIVVKVLEVTYKLNLLARIKIYPIQYITILEPAYRDIELLGYKVDIYRGQEEDKQQVLKIISYKDINNKIQYKIKQKVIRRLPRSY